MSSMSSTPEGTPWSARELRELIDRPPTIAYLHGHQHERWAMRGKHALYINAGSAGKLSRRPNEGPGYLRIEDGALVEGNPRSHDQYTVLPAALHEGASWENGWGCILTFHPVFAKKPQVYDY